MIKLSLSFFFFLCAIFYFRRYIKPALKEKIFIVFLYLIFIVSTSLFIGSNYFTGVGINESVVYTIFSDLKGAGLQKYLLPFALLLLFSVLFTIISVKVSLSGRKENHNTSKRKYAIFSFFFVASFLSNPGVTGVYSIISSRMNGEAGDFSKYYYQTNKKNSGPKKNIVYIYAESLERTYFDKNTFPGLTDELSDIKDKSYDFNNTIQLPGTDYTIAGIVASQCGLPLFAPFSGNSSDSLSSFFPGTICLGDILKSSGYNLSFIQGADLDFGGKRLFFSNHGFEHLSGREELAHSITDKSYINDWGWYDDTIFAIAYDNYLKLVDNKKPFGLFLLTVDTHHPDGFISKNCQKKSYNYNGVYNSSMSAVSCSQEQIAHFIKKIVALPSFKNTVIVVSSDHLAMNNTASFALNKLSRRNLFMVIDSDGIRKDVNTGKLRNTFDNGATILDLLGGDTKLGLGRSSLQSDSLFDSFPDMISKVNSWKNSVIELWGFPKVIEKFKIIQDAGKIEIGDTSFKLPALFKINKNSVDPFFDRDADYSLSQQLSMFDKNDKFFWIDDCFKINHVFTYTMDKFYGLCLAYGSLAGKVDTVQISSNEYSSSLDFSKLKGGSTNYDYRISQLEIPLSETSYNGNAIDFSFPGKPEFVKSMAGLSYRESWGRWTDAAISRSVVITFKKPLPHDVQIEIEANSFKNDEGGLVDIKVGSEVKRVEFKTIGNIQGLAFSNKEQSSELVITPVHPSSPLSHGESGDARILGLGLKKLTVNL